LEGETAVGRRPVVGVDSSRFIKVAGAQAHVEVGNGLGRLRPEVAGASDSSAVDIVDAGLRAVLGGRWRGVRHSSGRTSGTRGSACQ
jgi:hypothetical protein